LSPADLTQRDGRIIRQGNANASVHNFKYATIGSYDSAAWDGIQRKATMIQQVLRGRLDIREIEDVGDLALNAAQIKAATSGNPLVMEKIEADTARTKLERLKRAHEKGQNSLEWTRASAEASIAAAGTKLPALKEAIARITPTAGEGSTAVIDGRRHEKRADVVGGISEWVRTHTPEYGNYNYQARNYGTIAVLGGHELQLRNAERDSRLGSYQDLAITIKDVPAPATVFSRLELLDGSIGIITRLENKVAGLPDYAAQLEHTIAERRGVLADVDSQQGKPFKHEERLTEARALCAELEAKLKASIDPPRTEEINHQPSTPAAAAGGTEPTPGLEDSLRAKGAPEQAIRARLQAEKIMKYPITHAAAGRGTSAGKTSPAADLSQTRNNTRGQTR
jgi:hypothetical protein